jgi:hypothetical protein
MERNYPKHVEFHSKIEFEKLVHLVGFIIGIFHDVQSRERQNSAACFKDALNFLLHKYVKLICRSVFVGDTNAGVEKVK